MRLPICMLLVVAPLISTSQIRRPGIPNPVNNTNHETCLLQASALINAHNPDSNYKATRILWDLCLYDSCLYPFNKVFPLLYKIENSNHQYLCDSLQGIWYLIGRGTSGYGTLSDPTPQTTIAISHDSARFYSAGHLKRTTTFSIEKTSAETGFLTVNFFNIVFSDTKEKWGIRLEQRSYYHPVLRQVVPVTVTFNQQPGCSCGCPEELYGRR